MIAIFQYFDVLMVFEFGLGNRIVFHDDDDDDDDDGDGGGGDGVWWR